MYIFGDEIVKFLVRKMRLFGFIFHLSDALLDKKGQPTCFFRSSVLFISSLDPACFSFLFDLQTRVPIICRHFFEKKKHTDYSCLRANLSFKSPNRGNWRHVHTDDTVDEMHLQNTVGKNIF